MNKTATNTERNQTRYQACLASIQVGGHGHDTGTEGETYEVTSNEAPALIIHTDPNVRGAREHIVVIA